MKFSLLMVLFFTTLFSSGEACIKKKEIITWRCSSEEGKPNHRKTDECCEKIKAELSKDGNNCNEELKGMANKPKREISRKRRERIDEAMKCCNPPGSEKKTTKAKSTAAKSTQATPVQPAVLQPIVIQLTVVQSTAQPTVVADSTMTTSTKANSTTTTSSTIVNSTTADRTTANSTMTTSTKANSTTTTGST